MNIVLIGYRACGKSSVGRVLSDRLGWPLLDTDLLIEQRCGMTIRDLFADRAEDAFRAMERRIVAEVARLDRRILSTGGGAVLDENNARALKRNGLLVWLTAAPETVWQRILTDRPRLASRPDFDRDRGLQEIRDTIQQRVPSYRRWADATVDTDTHAPEAVAADILELVKDRLSPPASHNPGPGPHDS